MAAVTSRLLSWRDRLVALSVLEQDALLYLLAAVFALGTISLAVSDDYRQWAEMALGPYVVATVICWYASRRRAPRGAYPRRRAGRATDCDAISCSGFSSRSCWCPSASR